MKFWYRFEMKLPFIKDNDNQIKTLLEQHYKEVDNFSIYYFNDGLAELIVELPIEGWDISHAQEDIIKLLKENNYLDLENIKELIDNNDLTSYVYPFEIDPMEELYQEDFEELFKEELGE